MNKIISEYINNIAAKLKQGNATEHTYRGDLQIFIEAMSSNIKATNEPKRIACGAPDYIVTLMSVVINLHKNGSKISKTNHSVMMILCTT